MKAPEAPTAKFQSRPVPAARGGAVDVWKLSGCWGLEVGLLPCERKLPPKQSPNASDPFQASQQADWQNFRDHLTTTNKLGQRQWIYAKKPQGKWTQRRTG